MLSIKVGSLETHVKQVCFSILIILILIYSNTIIDLNAQEIVSNPEEKKDFTSEELVKDVESCLDEKCVEKNELVLSLNFFPVDFKIKPNVLWYGLTDEVNNYQLDKYIHKAGYNVGNLSGALNQKLNFSNLNNAINSLSPKPFENDFERRISIGMLMEAISNESQLSNIQASQKIANFIESRFEDKADQIAMLASIAAYLADDYDDFRNPGRGENSNTAFLDLREMALRSRNNSIDGGICNDIVASVGNIAQQLSIKADVFSIQTAGPGSQHFVLFIGDKEKQYVVDYGSVSESKAGHELQLTNANYGMNLRIMGLKGDGRIGEIGVYADDYGQFLHELYQNKISLPANSAVNAPNFLKLLLSPEGKKAFGVGASYLHDGSTALVFYGKFKKDKNHFYTLGGIDLGVQANGNLKEDPTVLKFHFLYEKMATVPVIHYLKKDFKLDLKFQAGLGVDGMVAYSIAKEKITQEKMGLRPEDSVIFKEDNSGVIFDGNLGSKVGFNLESKWKNYHFFNAQFFLDHQLGAGSYGNQANGVNFLERIEHLSFIPNQVNASVEGGNSKLTGKVAYQGDALGQVVSLNAQLKIDEIFPNFKASIGVGQNFAFGGWKTGQNYNDIKGPSLNLTVQNKKSGSSIKLQSSKQLPLQVTYKMPLSGKSKNKKPMKKSF